MGLDNAGKTTLIKRITEGTFFGSSVATVGLDTKEYLLGNTKYVTWDISGQRLFREKLWNTFLRGSSGIVWVIDSADQARFPEVKKEMSTYVFNNREVANTPLLIFCTKQDLRNAASVKKILKTIELKKMKGQHPYTVLPTSAKTGKNLDDGLDWLRDRVN